MSDGESSAKKQRLLEEGRDDGHTTTTGTNPNDNRTSGCAFHCGPGEPTASTSVSETLETRVTAEEARGFIHRESYAGVGKEDLFIPVPDSSRWVRVGDIGNGEMYVYTSRPGDVPLSQALSVWGDQPLRGLVLHTDWSGGQYGPPHTATREEWEGFFHHVTALMPVMTIEGYLFINNNHHPCSWYDDVLGCIPPALPRLVAKHGVRRIKLNHGRVRGRAVLAFMAALHHEGWSLEASRDSRGRSCCMVKVPGGHVGVSLRGTRVVGGQGILEQTRRITCGLLDNTSWEEGDDGFNADILYQNACELGTVTTSRGRIVVLGHGGAGKTSLSRCLMGMDFKEEHEETNLIDIHQVKQEGEVWKSRENKYAEQQEASHLLAAAMKARDEAQKSPATYISRKNTITPVGEAVMAETYPSTQHLWPEPTSDQERAMIDVHSPEKPAVSTRQVSKAPPDVVKIYERGQANTESLSIWDFAGQKIFYVVHQIFLTINSVYLIVYDLTLGLDENIETLKKDQHGNKEKDTYNPQSQRGYINFFLRTINSRREGNKVHPKVMFVCTKSDLVSPDVMKLRIDALNHHLEKFMKDHDMKYNVGGVYTFSSKCPGSDLHSLRCLLKDALRSLTVNFPVKWILFRNEIKKERRMTWLGACKAATTTGIKSEDEVYAAMKYFHSLGEVLFIDTHVLKNFIICDPAWLIDQIRKVITIPKYQEMKTASPSHWLWSLLNDRGILHEVIINECWKDCKTEMISLMEKFDLILPWKTNEYDGACQYLIPCLLRRNEQAADGEGLRGPPPIFLQVRSQFFPVGFTNTLLNSLTLKNKDKWKLDEEGIFSNSAKFQVTSGPPSVNIRLTELQFEDKCIIKIANRIGREFKAPSEEEKVVKALQESLREVQLAVHNCLVSRNVDPSHQLLIDCQCGTHHVEICQEHYLQPEVSCKEGRVDDFDTQHYAPWFKETSSLPQPNITDLKRKPAGLTDELVRKLLQSTHVRPELLERIEINEIMVACLGDFISRYNRQELLNVFLNRQNKVEKLLTIIENNGRNAFIAFTKALHRCKQEQMLKILISGLEDLGLDISKEKGLPRI